MSNWTHVAGIIRIDDIGRCLGRDSYNLEKRIGENLPYGSEGALELEIWEHPNKQSLWGYTVSIFGDLRDHESADEVVDWFKDVCSKFTIRDAVITAKNNLNGSASWIYEGKDNK